jgi:superfamily II DNA or RNA helicase
MAQASRTSPAAAWRVGSRVRVRGRHWRIDGVELGDDCTALRLEPLAAGSRHAVTVLTPFDRPSLLEQSSGIAVVNRRRCLHEIDRALAGSHPFGGLTRTAHASIRVLPYQLAPALAMLRHGSARVLVADAVGLGKTIEAGLTIAELTAAIESARILVLSPAGLREQWRQELAAHFALASQLADSEWLRRTAAERPVDVNPWSLPGIYVASHDLIKRAEALRALEDVTWDLVVIDEAHAATIGTDRRAAIHRVACSAQRVMLLTATPPAGDPRELAALCAIGRAEAGEPAPAVFARRSHDVRPGTPRRSRVMRVSPTASEIAMHRALERYSDRVCREAAARHDDRARLASIILRKRALSSAWSLLISLERRIDLLRDAGAAGPRQLALPLGDEDPLDDGEPIEALAAPGLDDTAREVRWLRAIAETARAAARDESKPRWLLRLLGRVREPVIVFTEYRDTLARLESRIASSGRSLVVLHGGLDPASRSAVATILGAGAQTLLATDAAAEGLNLHHRCRIVVHFELPWNPARLEQRAGRVDRIGQAARVHELALVSATTAERLVLEPLARRAAHVRRTGFGSDLCTALTESRIADAVMSGSPLDFNAPAVSGWNTQDALRLDLDQETGAEAARVETQRTLIHRSPQRATRSCSGRTRTVWATRARSRGPRTRLTLLFVVDVENGAGRRVHGEHVVIQLDCEHRGIRRHADLRALVASLTDTVRNVVDEHARAALEKVTPLATLTRERMERRRVVISRVRTSAAQQIVQLPLLGPAADTRNRFVMEPTPIEDAVLVARHSLVAAIVQEAELG